MNANHLILTVLTLTALAAAPAAPPTPAEIDKALAAIANYELGSPRAPLSEVERIVLATTGHDDLRLRLEGQLAALLDGNSTLEAKQFACEQLWRIGTEQSMPILRRLVLDERTAHMACLALRTNPSPIAPKVLREALPDARGKALLAIVNTLGDRRDSAAIAPIERLIASPEPGVADAALSALGRIGDAECARILSAARPQVPPPLQPSATAALLECAQNLCASGDTKLASSIFEKLMNRDEPMLIRRAALVGLLEARGDDAMDLVFTTIRAGEGILRPTAIARIGTLKGSNVTSRAAAELPRLAPADQVLVIGALAERGDPVARAAVDALLKSGDADVRMASIIALRRLGDASSAPALIAIASRPGQEADAALATLRSLKGEQVDQAVLRSLQNSSGPARIAMIQLLEDRNATRALPVLLREARSTDPAARNASLHALSRLAGPGQIPALIDLVISADDASRAAAEDALLSACRKAPEGASRSSAVAAAFAKEKRQPARLALLRVLGNLADDKAFAEVRAAVNDQDASVRDLAVRLLANWPNAAPIDLLKEVATGAAAENQRVLALRGFIRMIGIPSDRSADQTIQLYQQAMQLAKRPEEKNQILAGLTNVNHPAALTLALSCIEDPASQAEAALVVTAISRQIVDRYPAEVNAALSKAIPLAKDPRVRADMVEIQKKAAAAASASLENLFKNIQPVSLFDGKTFTGWEGPMDIFRIEDGAIVGGSMKQRIARNEFLTTKKEYADFELRVTFKLLGRDPNAGVQFRSRRIPNNNEMRGYQADMGQQYWGSLYDESRRNRVLAQANMEQLNKVLRRDDWNEYIIRCVGRRIQLSINGLQTVDYTEPDEKIEQAGLIGLQIHAGDPSEAWYKNITIRELPASAKP